MSKEVILVVDDNRQIADITAGSILPSMGYDTAVAYNGRSALNLLLRDQQRFSLILLDLQMPDYSGLELLRKMNNEGLNVPAILVTAHGSEQVAADAFRLGVQDYLTKPVDVDLLNEAVTRALSESRLRREKAALTAQLQEQVSWLTALSNVGRSVTSTLNLSKVLRRIVDAGVLLTRADQGFLALVDEENDKLFLRAVKNIDEDRSSTIRMPVKDTLVGEVLTRAMPVRKTRTAKDTPLKVSTGLLVYSLIHVPLLYQGKALGVLSVNNHTNMRSFSEKDEAVLNSLADYAAIAIVNANLYEQAQQEIRERKVTELALRDSEERYALAVRGVNDGLWDWDIQQNKAYFSPRWKSILGWQDNEIRDTSDEWFSRVHPDDIEKLKLDISAHIKGRTSHFSNEHRMRHKDGEYHWVLSRGIAVWDEAGIAVRMVGSQSDINDRKLAEDRLIFDAFHDALTQLPNRALLMDRLNQAIKRANRRDDYIFAVIFMDLDRFKDVNDSFGHLTGDKLLIAVGNELQKGLRATDTLARFGGDEYVILLEDIIKPENANRVIEWIQKQLTLPFNVGGHEVFTTVSMGIVYGSSDYTQAEDMLRDADIAMYVAKARGGARSEVFEPGMRQRILQRLALETDMRKALESDDLRVYYQPIVHLESGTLIGFEALARWQHPEHGLLQPMDFIPLAEETGMIVEIDRFVLKEACYRMKAWQAQYHIEPSLTISTNISGKHITNPDLVDFVEQVLKETGLNAESLKLEITERTIVDYNHLTAKIFSDLQKFGVQIQIDDFGVGYSSLGYLSRFPVNALKISQDFVDNIVEDSSQRDIVQAIVMLTDRLKVRVIAEGVETQEQLDQLRELGCEFGQGFLVANPLDHMQVEKLLTMIMSGKKLSWNELEL
jgi:diguanylate cyclase (GGDEF)-like protein/PAS domain S-box-containing protein